MTTNEPPRDDSQPNSSQPPTRLFRSEELLRGDKIVCIDHEGTVYRLQVTSRGKLILQK